MLIKEFFFQSRTSLFSFTPRPHFNVVTAAKSIGQSYILNTEKGEGGIDRIKMQFHCKQGKNTDYSSFFMSVPTILHGIVDYENHNQTKVSMLTASGI